LDKREQRLHTLKRSLDRLNQVLVRLNATSDRLTLWRVFAFLGAGVLGLAGLAVGPQTNLGNWLGLLTFGLGMLPFLGLVMLHRRVEREIAQFTIWRGIRRTHLARMELDWAHIPASTATPPHEHPFAIDIDITGEYSLHRLLDTSVSKGGSRLLLDWLLERRPDMQAITHRQALIRELRERPIFRDRLTLNGMQAAKMRDQKWDSEGLLRWLQMDTGSRGASPQVLGVLIALAAANITLFLAFTLGLLPPLWVGTFIAYAVVSTVQWRNLGGLFDEALTLQSQLRRLQSVFSYLETYHYRDAPHLRALCAPFIDAKIRPTGQLRRIVQISAAASLQRNPFVWLMVNFVVPWDIFFGTLLERSKGNLAETLPEWLHIWYELETLASFGTFAYINPDYTFPTVTDDTLFTGEELGHPLIQADEKVTNDFHLDAVGEAIIVTGSNMAGKSSFLRTVGVNLRLAYCGSVVNATHFETRLFRLFTSIRVTDSVVDGFSYFYAEVRRLKALLGALRDDDPIPLFFLIDEIFRGTNNRERLIGSRSYIQALIGGHGVGLISTHDLELVKLADTSDKIDNYHFREEVIDGKMVFDYRLRPGPSPTTNALTIMRMEGLPVDAADITDVEGA